MLIPSVPLTSLGATANRTTITVASGASHTAQITPSFVPTNATGKTVTYESGDTATLTVNASGLVTAVAEKGTPVDVTVTHASGKTAKVSFTVTA